jgi:hypothetical protein
MKLSDFVDGTCDELPRGPPTNKDVLRFFLHFNEQHKQSRTDEVALHTTCMILTHYCILGIYDELELHQPQSITRSVDIKLLHV